MTDTERLDYLESLGSIEIECDMLDRYSIGDQIEEGKRYSSLRVAIEAHASVHA